MVDNAHTENELLIRPLAEEDLAGWLALLNAVEIEQSGAAQTTEDHLRRAMGNSRIRRWVVEASGDPSMLAAYGLLFAQIKERSALQVLVHPAWRSSRAGAVLLDRLLEEARKIGADWANVEMIDTDQYGIALLEQAGFEPFSHAWLLRAPAEVDFPPPMWPEGYSARSFAEVNDLAVFTQAINRGYGDMWGHSENTAGGVTSEEAQGYLKNFDPHAVFIGFAPDGSPAGACRVEPVSLTGSEEDVLDGPGIAPEHRALLLHIPLALHALAYLRSLGRHPVRLESWGDSPETIAQYEALGFTVAEHYRSYRKQLVFTESS